MSPIYISATELKNQISEIINRVYFERREVIVKRHGKELVKIVPTTSSDDADNIPDRTFGSLPDFPDVTKDRRSGRRKINL